MNQALQAFADKWKGSEGAERSSSQQFLLELCDALGVERPPPPKSGDESADYRFERHLKVTGHDGAQENGFVDLYKAGHFVLESKQGSERGGSKKGTAARGTRLWDVAMEKAFGQAIAYAKSVEKKPVFIVVCDVGHCFDLYACFDDGDYHPFPHALKNRIALAQLPEHTELFATLWTNPKSLDPRLRQEKVTREVAEVLAELTRLLEKQGHGKQDVSEFLMRCVFAMFAEDVELLPKGMFTRYLEDFWVKAPKSFPAGIENLFRTMNTGGALITGEEIRRFNGGLYSDARALPLDIDALRMLLRAAKADWRDVDPSIFGTLLERALDADERHKLGAHFTPRAYVERLVRPTVEEPLREDWEAVRATVRTLVESAESAASERTAKAKRKEALDEVRAFHRMLCELVILDPACGTGNFLYVTLDVLKRLEAEVLVALAALGDAQGALELAGTRVTPAQFRGIDINPRAKPIAELVLWLGYLQWQFRHRGLAGVVDDPVLRDFGNIECRDALLTWDGDPVARVDASGKPVTRWDGKTTKTHPVTGKQVPDDRARIAIWDYPNARAAEWPRADFIVGNPPFLGNARQRDELGDGYVEALRHAYPSMSDGSDFVMYWVHVAFGSVARDQCKRAGLITTNSITQSLNRKVVEPFFDMVRIDFAVPDHPWVDDANGAAVRVAIGVFAPGQGEGRLCSVVRECSEASGAVAVELDTRLGRINSDFSIGANWTNCGCLEAALDLSFMGIKPYNSGFIVNAIDATKFSERAATRSYLSGRDLTQESRNVYVIDFFGRSEEEARDLFPWAYQHVLTTVKPERDADSDVRRRTKWWLHERSRPELRAALAGLGRYIATPDTSKHKPFVFLGVDILPDASVYSVASDDAFHLGVLSSQVHQAWLRCVAPRMGIGNDLRWKPTIVFQPFPFPDPPEALRQRIRDLGERLDAHRKKQQSLHPALTITGMYNVLEALRAGRALTDKERPIHEHGLVSTLKQIHDDLDAAVFEAYGWPQSLSDEEILQRLVDLNHERAEEEKRGQIRWLRPEYQRPLWEARQAKLAGKRKPDVKVAAASVVLMEGDAVGRSFAPLRMTDGGDGDGVGRSFAPLRMTEGAESEVQAEASPTKRARKARAASLDVGAVSAELASPPTAGDAGAKPVWPKGVRDRIVAVRDVMNDGVARTAKQVAALYTGGTVDDVADVLAGLAASGALLEGSIGGGTIWQRPVRPSLRPSSAPVSGGIGGSGGEG